MPVPRNAPYLRNPHLYAPLSQGEAERQAREQIDLGCAAVVIDDRCAIVIRRDGTETAIGVAGNWTSALSAALSQRRSPPGALSTS